MTGVIPVSHHPKSALELRPGLPLWQVVPTRDEKGERLCDFMMIIPRLKSRQARYIQRAQAHIARVLSGYEEVVFANMDLELNVLWVSHRFRRGLMLEIAGLIRLEIPEAVLVAYNTRG